MTESHAAVSSHTLDFARHLIHEVENSEHYDDRSERCFELRCGEALYSHLERRAMLNNDVPVFVKEIVGVLGDICDQRSRTCSSGWEAVVLFSWRFIIPEDTLRYLIEYGFSVPNVLGVSTSTIRRSFLELCVAVLVYQRPLDGLATLYNPNWETTP